MKITTNAFLAFCEKNDPALGEHIVSNFIATMRIANWREDMSSADWLSVFLNDYYILVGKKDFQLIPINGGVDLELHTEYNLFDACING